MIAIPDARHHGRRVIGIPSGGLSPSPSRANRAYQIVQQHLETDLALAREGDWDAQRVPASVERECRRYLESGIMAYGFALALQSLR